MGEGSPGAIPTSGEREEFPNAVTEMDSALYQWLGTAASHTESYPAANLRVPQNQNLQGFSRLSQSLMEVGQSMILVPKSPLIEQRNNSGVQTLHCGF